VIKVAQPGPPQRRASVLDGPELRMHRRLHGGKPSPESPCAGTCLMTKPWRETAVTPDQVEIAGQIERAYHGYHVWVSDEGVWYATRMNPRARGHSATVWGASPEALTSELAEEETAAAREHHDALTCRQHYPRNSTDRAPRT